jgi:hypothetical protein
MLYPKSGTYQFMNPKCQIEFAFSIGFLHIVPIHLVLPQRDLEIVYCGACKETFNLDSNTICSTFRCQYTLCTQIGEESHSCIFDIIRVVRDYPFCFDERVLHRVVNRVLARYNCSLSSKKSLSS